MIRSFEAKKDRLSLAAMACRADVGLMDACEAIELAASEDTEENFGRSRAESGPGPTSKLQLDFVNNRMRQSQLMPTNKTLEDEIRNVTY